ncbi:hypothetical protein GXW74_19005 [Roseomonas eburnea]|uniref:Uncharacterized protein n=1 Tax=Neoroseomonas eburnea TaxID=1346889 RepID=A0A9X9XFV3_9PROT|nr:hypothetical protein [Neoroseomonas eburnea]MBR0682589.1 hypothetical protein [Neoroseomonas eburnea]
MAWVAAIGVGLLGALSLVSSVVAAIVTLHSRRAFEAALVDGSDDGLRARGMVLVERVRNPLLRWIINRRTGAMAGKVLAGVVRDRFSTLLRGSVVGAVMGVAAIILAFFIPGLMQ